MVAFELIKYWNTAAPNKQLINFFHSSLWEWEEWLNWWIVCGAGAAPSGLWMEWNDIQWSAGGKGWPFFLFGGLWAHCANGSAEKRRQRQTTLPQRERTKWKQSLLERPSLSFINELMKRRGSGESWFHGVAHQRASRGGKSIHSISLLLARCAPSKREKKNELLGCGLLCFIAGLWAAAPLAAAEFHSINWKTIDSISSFSPFLVLLLSPTLSLQPIKDKWKWGKKVNEWRESWARKHITFHCGIWRMKFFNGASSSSINHSFHSFLNKEKNSIHFWLIHLWID